MFYLIDSLTRDWLIHERITSLRKIFIIKRVLRVSEIQYNGELNSLEVSIHNACNSSAVLLLTTTRTYASSRRVARWRWTTATPSPLISNCQTKSGAISELSVSDVDVIRNIDGVPNKRPYREFVHDDVVFCSWSRVMSGADGRRYIQHRIDFWHVSWRSVVAFDRKNNQRKRTFRA